MKDNTLPVTFAQAVRFFSDEPAAINFLAAMRWPDGKPICPRCTSEHRVSFLQTRLIWKCLQCKKQFSVKVGTIFEDSAIKLTNWMLAIWLISSAKNGISSYELGKAIGVTQRSAWFMLHRIRTAMAAGTFEVLKGQVETDESYFGGQERNKHVNKRTLKSGGRSTKSKTAVFGMLERKGRVRASVINKPTRDELHGQITKHVAIGSEVMSDQWPAYDGLEQYGYIHQVINHSVEYVRGNVHTNSIENFWSLMKRTIKGTYISVEAAHLQKYVNEQAFRYNERKATDLTRFMELVKNVSGKRLTYADLVSCQI